MANDYSKVEKVAWKYIWIVLAFVVFNISMWGFAIPALVSMKHAIAPMIGFGLYAGTAIANLAFVWYLLIKPVLNIQNAKSEVIDEK